MSPSDLPPHDCPAFEYEHHPDRATKLPHRVAAILSDLRRRIIDSLAAACDTREVHQRVFSGLTPPRQPYYAGHYRGEDFHCLRRYRVFVNGREGCPPSNVHLMMAELSKSIATAITALDVGNSQPNSIVPPELKLIHTIQVACRFFDLIGQVCLWAILARYGYFPVRWPIDPRPPDPPYTQLLLDYRAGNRDGLEQYILGCLA
jgi:hypothetical protein